MAKSPSSSGLDHEVIDTVIDVFCLLLSPWLRRNTFHSLPPTFLFFINILLKGAKEVWERACFLSQHANPSLSKRFIFILWTTPNFCSLLFKVSVDQEPLKPCSCMCLHKGIQDEHMKVYKRSRINKLQWRRTESPLQSYWDLWFFCPLLPGSWRICSKKWNSLLHIEFN